ncbi:MAG: NmrA family NAD(P)-binding protein [Pseudomonadota bacterium]
MTKTTVLIVGAGGPLGLAMVRALRDRGHPVIACYRTRREGLSQRLAALGAEPRKLDLSDAEAFGDAARHADAAIFSPILTVSRSVAPAFSDGRPAVFFSSNNVAVHPEDPVYARLKQAEQTVLSEAPGARILRPTMIYGHRSDGNLARLMAFMQRSPITPMPGRADARQQPVFFEDLAAIAVERLLGPLGEPIAAAAGPLSMTKWALYEAVAKQSRSKTIITPVPVAPLGGVLRLWEALRLPSPISAAQLARINRDKHPRNGPEFLGKTALDEGLRRLARDLDEERSGA